MTISLRNLFYAMACIFGLVAILYFAKPILIPLSIGLLISFILYPVCIRIESWGLSRIPTSLLCIFLSIVIVGSLVYLFSSQIVNLLDDFSNMGVKLNGLLSDVIQYSNKNIDLIPEINIKSLKDKSEVLMKESGGSLVFGTVGQIASIFSNIILVIVFTFLLLIYRRSFLKALSKFAEKEDRKEFEGMVREMQKVGQSYLLGVVIMILILGTANSVTLLLFGIEHAIFFGILAGTLAIIPYVGTWIGATIPVFYSFMTEDSLWVPLGVIAAFWIIQLIESNFLSPKIIGGNLNINALVAILSLVIGGYLWGIVGMAVFLPLTAIFKVLCSHYKILKPVALLVEAEDGAKKK